MPTLREEIRIDAPVEDVFEYMTSPENHAAISPGLAEVRDVRPLPNGGHEAAFTFRMLGRDLDAHSRDVEFERPRRRVYEFEGDVDGRVTYEFDPVGDATRFVCVTEFEPPGPRALGGVTGAVLRRYIGREMRALTRNAKAIIEAARTEAAVAAGAG